MPCLRMFVLLFVATLAVPCRGADGPPPTWRLTGIGHGYQLDGKGDPADAGGAVVTLRSADADPALFGGALISLDATPYRGHLVMLSADITTRDATTGAAL